MGTTKLDMDTLEELKMVVSDLMIIGTGSDVQDLAEQLSHLDKMDSASEPEVMERLGKVVRHLRSRYRAQPGDDSTAARRLELCDEIMGYTPGHDD